MMSLFYIESVKIGILLIFAIILSCVILFLSYALSTSAPDVEKVSAYECGFEPFDDARNKFDIRFYLIAILFIVFDLEISYLFPWVLTLDINGWAGFFWMSCIIDSTSFFFFFLSLPCGEDFFQLRAKPPQGAANQAPSSQLAPFSSLAQLTPGCYREKYGLVVCLPSIHSEGTRFVSRIEATFA